MQCILQRGLLEMPWTLGRSFLSPFVSASTRGPCPFPGRFPRQEIANRIRRVEVSSMSLVGLQEQFEDFRVQLEETGAMREHLRAIASGLDSTIRQMEASLLPIHHSFPPSLDAKEKLKGHIPTLRRLYAKLADEIKTCPGQCYRYNDIWRGQTNSVVFLLAFLHWLDTGDLLTYSDAEALLGLDTQIFWIDIEDYLIGLCTFSNELYDLKKVEEVLYDVKIRGLLSAQPPALDHQS